jgi:DNA-binding transcriptional LysR family regulator
MDRLDAMMTVLEVVRAGSLSAAGRTLRMPLATVSRRVSELEAHLGAQLFTRTGRRLTLTPAGEIYVRACQRIIDDVHEAERAISGEYVAPKGSLTITAPVAFGRLHLLPVVNAFLKAYPQIDVRILFTENTLSLIEEQIDIALRIGPLGDSQLHARPIGEVRRVVCASPDYLEAHGVPLTPEDLAGRDCVTLQSIASVRTWAFRNGRREINQPIHTRLGTNATQAAVDAAVAGIGPTQVLAYQVAEEVRDRRLRIVLADYEPEPWPIHLVYVMQGPLPQKVRAFLDWATPRLKDRLKAVP